MDILTRKTKVIILGDVSGISAPEIVQCINTTPASIIYSRTTNMAVSGGSLDADIQREILDIYNETNDKENLVVVNGFPDTIIGELVLETLTIGDPYYAGVLTRKSLGLRVYHIFELKEEIDAHVYNDYIGMMEMIFDVDDLIELTKEYRDNYSMPAPPPEENIPLPPIYIKNGSIEKVEIKEIWVNENGKLVNKGQIMEIWQNQNGKLVKL